LTPEQRQAIKAESDAVFEEYRDGYQLEENQSQHRQEVVADD
jgi:hypothetical protein